MKKVAVDEVDETMCLAKDVCGTSGNILLGKGAALSSALGRRLKNWGIYFVYIEGEEETEEDMESDAISPEEIKANLEHKFELVLGNHLMKKIFDAVLEFRTKKR